MPAFSSGSSKACHPGRDLPRAHLEKDPAQQGFQPGLRPPRIKRPCTAECRAEGRAAEWLPETLCQEGHSEHPRS